MTRHVYFAFDYDDVLAVEQIRNSPKIFSNWDAPQFYDRASREAVRKDDDAAIKSWIRRNMNGSSVTIVCIGPRTVTSKWVRFEIEHSIETGNGILGISMTGMRPPHGVVIAGENPLDRVQVVNKDGKLRLSTVILFGESLSKYKRTYSWLDDGPRNIGSWIEEAAKQVGR